MRKKNWITLKKAYSVNQLEELRTGLELALRNADSLLLNAQNLETVDLSLMQVLIGFAYECERQGKSLVIVNTPPKHPLRLFSDKIGFNRFNFAAPQGGSSDAAEPRLLGQTLSKAQEKSLQNLKKAGL